MFKREFSIIAADLLVLLTCFPTRAQEEATSGTINGRVVNERGEPMPGASVSARAVGTYAGRITTSDAEGNFRFTALEPALYTISGFAPAYVSTPPEADTPAYYRIGDSVRLELIRGGVITGTVTNAAGEPITGIRVRAVRIRDAKGKVLRTPQLGGAVERPTDDRGIYRIYGVGPGTYLVSAGGGGNQSFQFNPYETDVPTYSPSSTRDNAAEYSVRGGEETTADIRYRSDPGHTVSGTARVAPTNGASIIMTSSDGSFAPASSSFQQPGARGFAVSGVPDGDYYIFAQEIIQNPSAGLTTLDFSVSEGKRLTVKGADVSGVELVPKPLGRVNGVVVLEPSKAPECQGKRKPLFGEMLVEVQRDEKEMDSLAPFLRGLATTTSPDQKGAFTMRNVTPGRYRFNPRFYARYWYLHSITIGTPAAQNAKTATSPRNDAGATWTVVRAGEQLSNLTVKLAEGAASIRGKITAAEGATVPAAMAIYLIPAERDRVDNVLAYFMTQVAADGTFAFNNLPPGRYHAVSQNPVQSELDTTTKLRLPESAEARTKLRRTAETQKVDIELKPCQNLADSQLLFK